MLTKWVTARRDNAAVSPKDLDLARENERLRRENCIFKEEREIFRKGNAVLRGPKAVSFRFVEEHLSAYCANQTCDLLDVSERGLRAYRKRPAIQG